MLVWARCTRRTIVVVNRRPIDLHPGWEVQVTPEELLAHSDTLVGIAEPTQPHAEEFVVLDEEEHP